MMGYNPTGVDVPPYGLVSLRWNSPHQWSRPIPTSVQIDGDYGDAYAATDLELAHPVRVREDGNVAWAAFPHPSAVGVRTSFPSETISPVRAFGTHGADQAPWLIQNPGDMAAAGPTGIRAGQYGEIFTDWPRLVRVRPSDQASLRVGAHLGPCPYEWASYRDDRHNDEAFDAMISPEGSLVCAGVAQDGKLALVSPRLAKWTQPYRALWGDDIVVTEAQLQNRWAFPAMTHQIAQDGIQSTANSILTVDVPGIYHVGFSLSARTAVEETAGWARLFAMTVGVYVLAESGSSHVQAGYYAGTDDGFSTGGGDATTIEGLWYAPRSDGSLGDRVGEQFQSVGGVATRYLFAGDRLVLAVKKNAVDIDSFASIDALVWWKHASLWVARVDGTSVLRSEPTAAYARYVPRRDFSGNSVAPNVSWTYSGLRGNV